MKQFSLKQYVKEHSQQAAAGAIGCHQTNISQMLQADREIYITEDEDGSLSWFEIKRKLKKANS